MCVCVCVCVWLCVCVCEGNSTHGSVCKCIYVCSHDVSNSNYQSACTFLYKYDPAALVIRFLLCSSSWLKALLTQFTSHTSGWLSTHAQTSMKYIPQVACAVIGMHSMVWVDLLNGHVPDPCRIGSRHAGLSQWKVKDQRYSKGCSQQSHQLRNTYYWHTVSGQ